MEYWLRTRQTAAIADEWCNPIVRSAMYVNHDSKGATMRIWGTTLCLAMALFWGQACTTIDVKTDFDPSADFTKFHTFAFAGLTDITKTGLLDNSSDTETD